jgi:anthranilate phosphoribosyltransferase
MNVDIMKNALNQLIQGQDLTRVQAREVMNTVMDGEATPAQIGAILTALRIKGECLDEVTGFAEVMREKADRVTTEQHQLLDTCGTGAIVAAAAGVRVAKHGNRAMSSKSGSADVLEALGVTITLTADQAKDCLEQVGICFMFAQSFHQSMKHAAAPRRELGFRTIFNLLGPLTNPAGADRQLMGVFDRNRTQLVAESLRELGLKRALVVASEDGLDEISVCAPTYVTELNHGQITSYVIEPQQIGLSQHQLSELAGGDSAVNAEIIKAVFAGEAGAKRDIILANAGAALYVSEKANSIADGVKVAAEAIDSGLALQKLHALVTYTGELTK